MDEIRQMRRKTHSGVGSQYKPLSSSALLTSRFFPCVYITIDNTGYKHIQWKYLDIFVNRGLNRDARNPNKGMQQVLRAD